MHQNLFAQKVKYAVIDATATGDNTVVAAVTGKKIRVLSFIISSSADAGGKFQSDNVSDTDITKSLFTLIAGNNTIVAPFNPGGWFETLAGEALLFDTGADTDDITGCLSYIEV